MKKVLFIIVLTFLLYPFPVVSAIDDDVEIFINEKPLISDTAAFIEKGITYVPFRAIAESLSVFVDYYPENKKIVATNSQTVVCLSINERFVVINGDTIQTDAAPRLIEGRTMVPLRTFIEAFGTEVVWKNNTIYISSHNNTTYTLHEKETDLYNSGNQNNLELIVEEGPYGMPLLWRIICDKKEIVSMYNEDGLYTLSKIDSQDVNGDGNQEILVYRYSTGSGGATGLNIFQYALDEWKEIFAIKNPVDYMQGNYHVKYDSNYIVKFTDKASGKYYPILLEKENYVGIEEMLNGISTWIDPISDYDITDLDGDGVAEVVTTQRVIGVSHPDTIALLKTTYKIVGETYIAILTALHGSTGNLLFEIE